MLDNYFNYKKHKTDFRTEVIAGVTTFLTMAYIMFLNPFILSGEFAGPEKGFFDFGAVYTATILATALACFIMAFYGKTWPIGLAPGMGINAFVAFGVCAGMGYTPQEALGAVLVAGVLFLIISLTPIRAWLINSIPRSLKLGIGAGIGLFLAIIGLQIMEVVVDDPVTLVKLGDLSNPLVLLGCATFIVIVLLEKMNVKGNIIIGILAFSIISWATGLANFNGIASAPPPMTYLFEFDLSAAMTAGMSTVIFTLLFIDFFDTAGTLTSVANVAGKVDNKGRVQYLWGYKVEATGRLPSNILPYPLRKKEKFPGKSLPSILGTFSKSISGPPRLNSILSELKFSFNNLSLEYLKAPS